MQFKFLWKKKITNYNKSSGVKDLRNYYKLSKNFKYHCVKLKFKDLHFCLSIF